jgi:hypothetical protein
MPATPALDGKTASQHTGNNNLIIKNPLSLADRQALLQLVNMGYVRGITSKLDEIAHRQPEHATAIQHLKTLTSQFDLKALQAHLQQEQWP